MNRSKAVGLAASGAALALIAGLSIVWPGLDAQRTPPQASTAWVLKADGLSYARLNTAIDELDTVRKVSNPSRIAATSDGTFMFTDSDSKVIRIDEALPIDLDAESLRDASPAPAGTEDVDVAGDFVAYRTDAGAVYAGRLSTGNVAQIEPGGPREEDDETPPYASDAIAVDAGGDLFSYSAADGTVIRASIATGDIARTDDVSAEVTSPALTAAGDAWVLVDTSTGTYWTKDVSEESAGTNGTIALSRADPRADAVYLADETGLVEVPTSGETATRVFGDQTTPRGTPARPVIADGVVHAAWLPEGSGPGTLWDSVNRDVPLDYAGQSLPSQRRPLFVAAGDALVLNDVRSGWVWTVPDGRLVPSSQNWELDDAVQTAPETGAEEPPAVIDPRPPVAVGDEFGVRPGALVSLPVLLNDHDPNEDVLAIDPASVQGLDPAFGTLTLTDDRQRLAISVAPDASGVATFSYVVSDGTSESGLLSAAATVTLRVAADEENSAPQWCGVEGCQQEWPEPDVAPGGTVRLPVLGDWVDPEGDPIILLSATEDSGAGQVVATPEGTVVFQHADTGGGGDQTVPVTLTVGDSRGANTTKTLAFRVSGAAAPQVQSFAVVDTVGSRVTIDVAPHVTGTAGTLTLSSARVLDDAAATATIVGGTTQFDFATSQPGSYRVAISVSSDRGEATGIARITLLAPDAAAQLSTSPVVAFVRPRADATVDVLAAVSNPTGRVLLLSDVVVNAASGSSLVADAVGQSQLRVSGMTSDEAPGLLGTVSYRVSDGSADDGASVVGQATVYLLPPAAEAAPITVDDSVVVRAGAQVDISVLENDVSAAGGRPRLDPESIESSSADALAFAAGDILRYLAPRTPGNYTIGYRAFTAGSPALGDIATVRVRVVAEGENRDPLPGRLLGRVASGMSTTIGFDGFGMDPDGDVVRLDRIVAQPEHGSAAISADGTSIVYTSTAGMSGQDSFTYRVIDPFGASGEGTVRIGVLSGEGSASPVTYTDYVQVQAGGDSEIRVHPLANDLDPLQGTLKITRVLPDIPATTLDGTPSAEYERLAGRISSQDDTTVTITAGTEPGTMSFFYDVESSSGNTARGLLVVKVVTQRVPDYPVVSDTILTAVDRDDLDTGVDVLSGKVLWSGGETGDLTLGLWGDQPGVTVKGDTVRATPSDKARIIPFSVTGELATGTVTTYAFLRVPSAADAVLALRPGTPPLQVAEKEQVDADVASLVAVPRGGAIEIDAEGVRASGARAAGACVATGGTSIRYTAGEGDPFTDACLVPVRLKGTTAWTVLSIPVVITPTDPQPILAPAALEVAPGQTQSYDLTSMTSWQGRAEPITYQIADTAPSFDVQLAGSVVTVRGNDDAVPGSVETVGVEVTSHSGVAPSRITLRVGAAPSTLPQGGQASQQCSQASGSSCTITVIGAAGEVNPLPTTALQVVAVSAASACTGVSFAVAGPSQVAATWHDDAPGATCSARFTVRDAQGRQSSAGRDGTVVIDLQGFPRAPASVAQSAFADGRLTLRVDPGAAQTSYPAVTGFEIRQGGAVVTTCTPQGVCPEIAAPNGEQREYEAVAVNGVGPSRQSVRTTAWAYDAPAAPAKASFAPIPVGPGGGSVSLRIEGVDAQDASALQISSPAGETITVAVPLGAATIDVPSFRVGSNRATSVTITPVSRFEAPPGFAGPSIGSLTISANGVGAPSSPVLDLSAVNTGEGKVTVSASGSATTGGDGSQLRYGIVPEGSACTVSAGGDRAEFAGLDDGRDYQYILCVESFVGDTSFGRVETTGVVRAVQRGDAPQGFTFIVDATPDVFTGSTRASGGAAWTIKAQPTSAEVPPNNNTAVFSGFPSSQYGSSPGIRVRYEHRFGWWQTAWADVTAAPGHAPYQVRASWQLGTCSGGQYLEASSESTNGQATITFGTSGLTYYDAAGAVLAKGSDPRIVPDDAVRVEGMAVTVSWPRADWGLNGASQTLTTSCTPKPKPTPSPTPTDPPSTEDTP